MHKPILFALLSLILFASCKKDDKGGVIEGEVKNPIISDIENITEDAIRFEVLKNTSDTATTELPVHLFIGQKDYHISSVRDWMRIEKSDYPKYQIPENATDAIRETSNEIAKVLYAMKQKADRVLVKEGLINEDQDSIKYKAILSMNSFDISPDPEIDYIDIVGTYGYTDGKKSQILILSLNKRNMLSAVIFNSEEAELPSKENIATILMNAKPTALKNFFLNELKRSFKSESYYGRYRKKDDQIIFIFDNMTDKNGNAVEFKKLL